VELISSAKKEGWVYLHNKQHGRCTCNVTFRRVRATRAISITNSEFVFVALGIDHEMCMRHIVFCGLSGSIVFFNDTIFEKMLLNLACVF
jgi:4-hydroxyphenylpyruvate dioxygenase-like putative hemolysin